MCWNIEYRVDMSNGEITNMNDYKEHLYKYSQQQTNQEDQEE